MEPSLTIGIAGCGIGGLAAALFFTRAGHKVTLFDQFDSPAPLGSGLVVQPVGLHVLDMLGLGDEVRAHGHRIYKMTGIEAQSKRTVLNVDYGPLDGEIYGVGIHRASLFDVLYQAAIAHNITVRSNALIAGSFLKEGPTSAHSQRFLETKSGDVFGPYDLVIDASGANSLLSPIQSRPLPYGALWGTVDWPAQSQLPLQRLSQNYRKAKHMLGVLPLGILPSSDTQKAAIFWSEKRGNLPAWPETSLEAWKHRVTTLWPEFEPFAAQISSHKDMTAATYSHGTLLQPYDERIAFIGDSAHQASPQLGQGANMALLDAHALSQAISLYRLEGIDFALKKYARKRRWHVQLYQTFSAVFTPFYQSDSQILPPVRDYVMAPLSQIWPVKPLLTRLVCGNLLKP